MNTLLSGPDKEFNNYMGAIRGDIDAGTGQHAGITYSELVAAAQNKFQNMVAQGEYGKVDPKETHLLALAIEVHKLRGQLSCVDTTSKAPGGSVAKPVDRSNDTPGLDCTIRRWNHSRHL